MPVLGKTKKHVVSEFRCSEILDAARGVFARQGFNAATVEDIADAAGLAKGTVYLYFRSKRDLYLATLRQGLEELQDEARAGMEAEARVAGKIRAFIRARLDFSERNRDFFRIYYTEFNNLLIHGAPVREEFRDIYDRQAAALTRVLDLGVESGELRDLNTAASARIVYDMTRGLIAQRVLGWSQATVEEDAGFLFDLIWKGVGCQ